LPQKPCGDEARPAVIIGIANMAALAAYDAGR